MNDRPLLVVVDDEPEVLRSVHDLLRYDYKVETFTRPADALTALGGLPEVSVVMSDQRMPEMPGVQFLHRAKELRPDATRLLMTGYADIKAVIDAINQGSIYRYITKPWEPDEFLGVIRQATEQNALIVEKNRLVEELKASNLRLREANRLKSAFIEVASHELNTPVTVVLGLTELWRMSQAGKASDAEKGWVDRIHAAGKRLETTVERMLKLLKSTRFSAAIDAAPVELDGLIRRAIQDLHPFLEARTQSVELALHPGLGIAEVDSHKLTDILTNLVVNAIKFTPDGGTIQLKAEPDGENVRFEVSDQGVGIAPEECPHLFEPFFTGYDTMRHSSGEYQFGKRGIGLGLCLVKTFVELHGGTVEVNSEPGKGSTFVFAVPRKFRGMGPATLPPPNPNGLHAGAASGVV